MSCSRSKLLFLLNNLRCWCLDWTCQVFVLVTAIFCKRISGFFFRKSVLDLHSLYCRFSVLIFSELALKIFKQWTWTYLNVSNFNSLNPDTPTLDNRLHTRNDRTFESVTVLDDLFDRWVCDAISDYCRSHWCNQTICNFWFFLYKILSKVHKSFHGTPIGTINNPDYHCSDFKSLHLVSDLVRRKSNFIYFRREDCNLIIKTSMNWQTNTCCFAIAITHNYNPLIRFSLYDIWLPVLV